MREGRVRTPMILQMESVECGAASLAIMLAYFGRIVPLATLRRDCGVSRDGAKCSNILKAAAAWGLTAKAYGKDLPALRQVAYPYIVFWNFDHFLVVEGYRKGRVYLNDPATGPRSVPIEEFDRSYTGVMVTMTPGPGFQRGGTRPGILRGLWHRLQGSLGALAAAIAGALLLVAPGLAAPALMQVFVDKVLIEGARDWGRPLVLGLLLTAGMKAALGGLELRILRRLQIRLAVAHSGRFVQHLLKLPAAYYAQRYAGEVSSRIALNDQVAEVLSGKLATTAIDSLMMVFYLAVMWQVNRPLTGVAAAFAAANFLIMRHVARRRAEDNIRLSVAEGKTAGVGIGGLQSIRTIKASGIEPEFFARWAGYFANLANTHQELSVTNCYLGVLPPLLTALMAASVLGIGGIEVIGARMTIGQLVAFQSLAASFLLPVNNLVTLGASMQELAGHISRLDDVLGSAAAGEPPLESAPGMSVRLTGRVEFRNVTFGYSPVAAPLIEDLSFTALPGQRIALVGASGSGKSTIVKLLAGLYAPLSGEILFDGVPIGKIPREILAHSLAMVDQDILLFQGTVRDNLTLWDASTSERSIGDAARDALIDSVIDALPQSYGSELLEGAANLSGGERQRLEIARALACDPSILVMDEAASALDSETELNIDRNLRRRGCTCFVVSHRLSSIRDSDVILVLEKGRVVGRGTHDQLIREDTPYAGLVADDEMEAAA